jgi:hypothetical protein
VLGDDARKNASARNPRPAQAKAAADEEPETLRARDGAEGRNEARWHEPAGDRPTERHPNDRARARKSALARRHEGAKRASMDGNSLTSKLRGASLRSRRSVPLERSVRR